ncbi:hypothetical protein IJ182_02820 [bacterium]|nr:hypothetical protein [bacterium]
MRISNNQQQNTNFKSLMTNKAVLKGLEVISEHSASFIAGTSLAMAAGVRPLAIALTPNTDKENKKYMIANSITSGLVKFAMVEAVALPIENAIKKINKKPDDFFTKNTIKNLKAGADNLVNSKDYGFATQLLKLGSSFFTAIPKSALSVALIPITMDLLFAKKHKQKNNELSPYNNYNAIFSDYFDKQNEKTPSFKGKITDIASKGISKILNNDSFQNVVKKHVSKSEDVARNITIATDLLLSASFAHRTAQNKDIEEKRKKPLIYNNLISTGLSVTGGYAIDKLVKKNTQNFIQKFSEANKNNPNLPKYIEGINIVRPTLIFAAIYYGIMPIVSAYTADKLSKISERKEN